MANCHNLETAARWQRKISTPTSPIPASRPIYCSLLSAIQHSRLSPLANPQYTASKIPLNPVNEQSEMSTLLRLFIRLQEDGCPSFEIAAPPGVLHYLFPPSTNPGMEASPFIIQHVPTNRHELVADLSSVLNTRQLKPNEDHFRIIPSGAFLRERLAQQTPVYPPPSAHPTHLRDARDRAPIEQDPELASIPGYRTIWIFPSDISSYLIAMGFRYVGSHVESCGPRAPGGTWDIHTFVGSEKLTMLLTSMASMSPSPQSQTYDENIGTPRVGSRVTFREEDSKSPSKFLHEVIW